MAIVDPFDNTSAIVDPFDSPAEKFDNRDFSTVMRNREKAAQAKRLGSAFQADPEDASALQEALLAPPAGGIDTPITSISPESRERLASPDVWTGAPYNDNIRRNLVDQQADQYEEGAWKRADQRRHIVGDNVVDDNGVILGPVSQWDMDTLIKNDIPNIGRKWEKFMATVHAKTVGGLEQFANETEGSSIYGDEARTFMGRTLNDPAAARAEGQALVKGALEREDELDKAFPVKTKGGQLLEGTLVSIGQQLPGLVLAPVTGGESAALTMMGVQSFGLQYGEDRAKGMSAEDAALDSVVNGITEAYTEKLGLDKFVKGMKSGWSTKVIRDFVMREQAGEHIATAVENSFGVALNEKDPAKRVEAAIDYLKSRKHLDDQMDTFWQTLMQSTLMGAAGKLINKGAGVKELPEHLQTEYDRYADEKASAIMYENIFGKPAPIQPAKPAWLNDTPKPFLPSRSDLAPDAVNPQGIGYSGPMLLGQGDVDANNEAWGKFAAGESTHAEVADTGIAQDSVSLDDAINSAQSHIETAPSHSETAALKRQNEMLQQLQGTEQQAPQTYEDLDAAFAARPEVAPLYTQLGLQEIKDLKSVAAVEAKYGENGTNPDPRMLDLGRAWYANQTEEKIDNSAHMEKAKELWDAAQAQRTGFIGDVKAAADAIAQGNPHVHFSHADEEFAVKSLNGIADKMAQTEAENAGRSKDQQKNPGTAVTDALRATIVIQTPEQAHNAIGVLRGMGYSILEIDDLYGKGGTGYKHIAVKLTKGNADPVVKELLFITPNMKAAKMTLLGGHDMYKIARAVTRAEKRGVVVPVRLQWVRDRLNKLSEELYDAAARLDSMPDSTGNPAAAYDLRNAANTLEASEASSGGAPTVTSDSTSAYESLRLSNFIMAARGILYTALAPASSQNASLHSISAELNSLALPTEVGTTVFSFMAGTSEDNMTGTTAEVNQKVEVGNDSRTEAGDHALVAALQTALAEHQARTASPVSEGSQVKLAGHTEKSRAVARLVQAVFGIRYVPVTGAAFNGVTNITGAPNTIFVDQEALNPLMVVAGHEVTHNLPTETQKKLMKFLQGYLKPEAFAFYKKQLEAAHENGVSEATALRELTADAVGQRMAEPGFWDSLAKFDQGVFKALANAARAIMNKILNRRHEPSLQVIQSYFTDPAAVRAKIDEIVGAHIAERVSSLTEQSDVQALNTDYKALTGEPLFSIHEKLIQRRKMANFMKNQLGLGNNKAGNTAADQAVDRIISSIGEPYAEFVSQVESHKDRYPEMGTTSLPKNTDPTYRMTVDLVGACVRMLRAMAIHRYVREQGRQLNSFQMRALETELSKVGFNLTCAYCYAFTRRTNAIAKLEEMKEQLLAGEMPDSEDMTDERKALWKAALRETKLRPGWQKAFEDLPDLMAIKTPADLQDLEKVSPEAAKFAKNYPAIHALKQKATDAGNMRMPTGTLAIAGQILNLSEKVVHDLKQWGGLRWQSNVDFIPAMTYDYVQGIVEMAMRDLPGHIYTKEVDLALLMGNNGFKINLSAAPLVRNGRIVWEKDKDGNRRPVLDVGIGSMGWADIEKAMAAGPDHTGVMMLGVNDEVLDWASTNGSPWAPYVIPYHSSGMPAFISQTFKRVLGAVNYDDPHESIKHYDSRLDVPAKYRLISIEEIGNDGEKTGKWVIDYTQLGKIDKSLQMWADEYKRQQDEYRKNKAVDNKATMTSVNFPPSFFVDQEAGISDVDATDAYFKALDKLDLLPQFETYRKRFEERTGKHHGERYWVFKKHYARTDTPFLAPDPKKINYDVAKRLDKEWSEDPMSKVITESDGGIVEAYQQRQLTDDEKAQINRGIEKVMSNPDDPMEPVLSDIETLLDGLDIDPGFSVKRDYEPKKTAVAYKLFRVDPRQPGKLFPLFVNANDEVPIGKWLEATAGASAGKGKVKSKLGPLAYRPGWHAGDVPLATHIGDFSDEQRAVRRKIYAERAVALDELKLDPSSKEFKKAKKDIAKQMPIPDWASSVSLRNPKQVWAEIEVADDYDWQTLANERGRNAAGDIVGVNAHITDQVPLRGQYRYKTNPNMTGNWIISGHIKVVRVLTDDQVKQINDAAGVADLPRKKPIDIRKLGFEPDFSPKAMLKEKIDTMPEVTSLPELHKLYFNMDVPGTQVIPVDRIRPSKFADKGEVNSLKRMKAAAQGVIDKRDPITVKANDDGTYTVTDGNGTYAGAKAMGWKNIPVTIEGGEGPMFSLSPEVVRKLEYGEVWPKDGGLYIEAAQNTPGAKVVADGVEINLVRFQKASQDFVPSVRTGVFYLPAGSKTARYYNDANGNRSFSYGESLYGGPVKLTGSTLLKAPYVVKAATGGMGPERAYDQLKGKGAYERVRKEISEALPYTGKVWTMTDKIKAVQSVLMRNGAEPNMAADILRFSEAGNRLYYAITENIVAHAVRAAGYDSVVSISKAGGKPVISEIFDVREDHYPGERGEYSVHPDFGGNEPLFSPKDMENFSKSMDQFAERKTKAYMPITVGETPNVLQHLGFSDLPITVTAKVLAKVWNDGVKVYPEYQDSSKHTLTLDQIKQLPRLLANPVMVLQSEKGGNSFIVVSDVKENGRPVMVAIYLDQMNARIQVNAIASMYGRPASWYVDQVDRGWLRYIDKKRTSEVLQSATLNSRLEGALRGYGSTVLTPEKIVKENFLGSNASFSAKMPIHIVTVGADMLGRDFKGNRAPYGVEYPEHKHGFTLNGKLARKIANRSVEGQTVIAVVGYADLVGSMENNPGFHANIWLKLEEVYGPEAVEYLKKAAERRQQEQLEDKMSGKRAGDPQPQAIIALGTIQKAATFPFSPKPGHKKPSIKEVAEWVAADGWEGYLGRVIGVGIYDGIEDRPEDELYDTEVKMKRYYKLPQGVQFKDFVNGLVKRGAIGGKAAEKNNMWVMLRGANLYLPTDGSPMAEALVAASRGDMSVIEAGPEFSAKPFTSKLSEVVDQKMGGKMFVPQLRAMLKNNGVSDDEIQAVLGEFDPGKSVTKAEVQEAVLANSVQIKDVILGEGFRKLDHQGRTNIKGILQKYDIVGEEAERMIDDLADGSLEVDELPIAPIYYDEVTEALEQPDTEFAAAQHPELNTPGMIPGTEREMFVTAPTLAGVMTKEQYRAKYHDWASWEDDYKQYLRDQFMWEDGHTQYSHIENPVARIRLNERDVDGKRILFVEEIQGPSKTEQAKMPEYLRKRIYDIAVKRVLAYAKEKGLGGVSWTTGKMQADRYDLSKHIDVVNWYTADSGAKFVAIEPKGKTSISLPISKDGRVLDGPYHNKNLDEVIGKDLAKKVLEDDKGRLSGLDLKVGGEGLIRLYDTTLPALFKKYGKEPIGEVGQKAQPGEGYILMKDGVEVGRAASPQYAEAYVKKGAADSYVKDGGHGPMMFIPITDKTPASFPLFSIRGEVPEETRGQKFWRKSQDRYNRLGVLENWIREQGVNLSEDALVSRQLYTMNGKIAAQLQDFIDKTVAPLVEEAAKKKIKLADIEEVMLAMHAAEANAQIQALWSDPAKLAFGMTDADARTILASASQETKDLAKRFQAITKDTAKMLLDNGIISDEMYQAWTTAYKNYIPLRGDGTDQKPGGTGKGNQINRGLKRRKGHEARDEAVIENIIKARENAIRMIEKNNVNLSTIQLLIEAKDDRIGTVGKPEKRVSFAGRKAWEVFYTDPRTGVTTSQAVMATEQEAQAFITVDRLLNKASADDYSVQITTDHTATWRVSPMLADNEINAYVAGHQVRIQINDEVAADALTARGEEQLNTLLMLGKKLNNWFSRAYTGYDPRFTIRNTIRDFTAGIINLTGDYGVGIAAKIAKNYPRAVKAFIKGGPIVDEYRAAGGSTGASYLSSLERIGENVESVYHEHLNALQVYQQVYDEEKANGASNMKARVKALAKSGLAKFHSIPVVGHFLKAIEHMNAISENAFRLATYMTLKEEGRSTAEAGEAAKNSTINFDKRGEWGATMGALFLFFNPAIQGVNRTIFAMTQSKHKAQANALVGAMALVGYLAAEFARAGGDGDDDEWDNIPRSVKNRSLVIRTGGKTMITLPLPYEYGAFVGTGYAISDMMHGKFTQRSALNLASAFLDGFMVLGNPITDEGFQLKNLSQMLPTSIKLAMAPAVNQNSFGSPIQPTKYSEAKPDSANMFRNTRGTVYEKITTGLNELTGGTPYSGGVVDVSPEVLKFYTRTVFGGALTFVDQVAQLGIIAASGDMPELGELPMANVLLRENTVRDTRARYAEISKEAKTAAAQFHAAQKARDFEVAAQLNEKNSKLISIAKLAEATGKLAKAKRDAVDAIRLDPDMSLAEKRSAIRDIEETESALYERVINTSKE